MKQFTISVPTLSDVTSKVKTLKTKTAQTIGFSLFAISCAYQTAKLQYKLEKAMRKED